MNQEIMQKLSTLQSLYKELFPKYVYGVDAENVHIREEAATEIAPLSDCTFKNRDYESPWPFEYFIVINGVKFFFITATLVENK